jgi:ketosteroid isomerase-like protein
MADVDLGSADMSDNVDLVSRSFEAMRGWDVDALLEMYDPDVEYLPLTGTRVESGGYRGHEGLRATISVTSATASWWQADAGSADVSAVQRTIRHALG